MTDRQYRPDPPESISAEARHFLAETAPIAPPEMLPSLDDADRWIRRIAERDAANLARLRPAVVGLPLTRELHRIERVPVEEIRGPLTPDHGGAVFLDFHGGALVEGGGELAGLASAQAAVHRIGVTWAVDYRMPPRHPYPAALDDALAVYAVACGRYGAERIVVSGVSAGGNLAAGLLLRARAAELPMPAGLVLLSPELDLTESGDSFRLLDRIDLLAPLATFNRLYAGNTPLEDPLVSPLFGDLGGFPPTFIQSGSRDLFLSNAIRMHRRLRAAGSAAELHVFEAMPHVGFGGTTPEDAELAAAVRDFEQRVLAAPSCTP